MTKSEMVKQFEAEEKLVDFCTDFIIGTDNLEGETFTDQDGNKHLIFKASNPKAEKSQNEFLDCLYNSFFQIHRKNRTFTNPFEDCESSYGKVDYLSVASVLWTQCYFGIHKDMLCACQVMEYFSKCFN